MIARFPFRLAAYLVAAALLIAGASTAHADAPAVQFGALLSAQRVMSGDTDPAIVPGLLLSARGPFAFGSKTPFDAYVTLGLNALPGETVDPGDVATFKSAELVAGLARRIGSVGSLRTRIYAEAGFATRLMQTPGPADRYPRLADLGLEVSDESNGARFKVGFGRADVAGPAQWKQVILGGQYPAYKIGPADLVLGADAVLTLGRSNFGAEQRDVFRVWIGAAVGK